ncbi:hypothetical protein BDW59DRAFT_165923 [Aspergillus cavernicola]|uniref:N-acetyltransferase domain-containing protein n=1 Tax=Aspergillus cavernicola TaxID=176166 RepID=A0ABR4HPV5_9EURO
MSLPTEPKQWTKQSNKKSFLISTDTTLLSLPAINAAFGSDFMYWASSSYPETVLKGIIDNSFCLGLYKLPIETTPSTENSAETESLEQIGFARLITDRYTFAYLTDVYVLPEYQGYGLGGWILDCVDEVVEPLPHLRWLMLRTGSQRSVEAYRRRFGMEVLDNGDDW